VAEWFEGPSPFEGGRISATDGKQFSETVSISMVWLGSESTHFVKTDVVVAVAVAITKKSNGLLLHA